MMKTPNPMTHSKVFVMNRNSGTQGRTTVAANPSPQAQLRNRAHPSSISHWGQLLLVLALLPCFMIPQTTTRLAQAEAADCPLYTSLHQRIGYNVVRDDGTSIDDYDAAPLGAGWYHDYGTRINASSPGGIQHVQMVRANINRSQLEQRLGPVIDANPGDKWILGNEPDRLGQDEMTPAEYAVFYHDVYTFLKQRDPTSIISPAGLVQPTPIRLRYLDELLAAYQQQYGTKLPADEWDMHNFILREDETWGAGTPVGLVPKPGEPILFQREQHGDINIFKQQLRDMRQWMADNGYRDIPLRISEMGILLSPWHGYDHETVRVFMYQAFDFMLTATDENTGYPGDDNRLVQEFAWFSLNYYDWEPRERYGTNGNLFDHETAVIQQLGIDFKNYVTAKRTNTIDLSINRFAADTMQITTSSAVTWTVDYYNVGGIAAEDVSVRFWNGDPANGGTLIGSTPVRATVQPGCQSDLTATYIWAPSTPGTYQIYAELVASNLNLDPVTANNRDSLTMIVTQGTGPTVTPTTTPTATSTATPSPTGTVTPTPSATGTATPTPTPTATNLGGVTNTPTATPSLTPTATGTVTMTPTTTATGTPVTSTPTGGGGSELTPTPTKIVGDGAKHKIFMPLVTR